MAEFKKMVYLFWTTLLIGAGGAAIGWPGAADSKWAD